MPPGSSFAARRAPRQRPGDALVIPATDVSITWASGDWLNSPPEVEPDGGDLLVTAAEGSDFWRTTAYDFVHDDGHGLLRPFEPGTAMEVSFRMDYGSQFDQAGILVRAGPRHWVKAGVEVVDGAPQLGAVVTHEVSDWSACPVPEWGGGSRHHPGEPCWRCAHHPGSATGRPVAARAACSVAARPGRPRRALLLRPDPGGPASPLHDVAQRICRPATPRVGRGAACTCVRGDRRSRRHRS